MSDLGRDDGLWSPGRRALTIGLILNVTIVASEALAVSTIIPIVARGLGGIDLYGWVFSGFFLGSLLGIVVAGMMIDRGSLARPFILGIGLFAIGLLIGGLAPSMAVLAAARVIQGFGAGAIPAVAYVSIARAMTRIAIDGASPPITRPIAKRAIPKTNGRARLPRSISIPATTIPRRLPRKNPEKTQP
jgi:MFS family permease